jgi:hypothetical protein
MRLFLPFLSSILAGPDPATMPPRPPGVHCDPASPGAAAVPDGRRTYIGVWQPTGSTARFRVCVDDSVPIVTGIDSHDGEVFRIRDARFDGNRLLFTSTMPSTAFTLRQEWRAQGPMVLDFTHTPSGQPLARVEE